MKSRIPLTNIVQKRENCWTASGKIVIVASVYCFLILASVATIDASRNDYEYKRRRFNEYEDRRILEFTKLQTKLVQFVFYTAASSDEFCGSKVAHAFFNDDK